MKRIYLVNLLLLLTLGIFAQSVKEVILNVENNENHSSFNNRKEKGFYSIMQASLLFGSKQLTNSAYYTMPYYSSSSSIAPAYFYPNTRSGLSVAPSFTITSGYIFNQHWATGAGVGFEIFDYNLFPLFAELRYTLWDNKMSPFVAVKGGYAFGNFKAKHFDELSLNWAPYMVNDVTLRHYGGFMFHPEIGVKVPLNENSDLLFTAAYRYQKTKSLAKKEYGNGQFDEWEHNEDFNRLSFSIAIMFR